MFAKFAEAYTAHAQVSPCPNAAHCTSHAVAWAAPSRPSTSDVSPYQWPWCTTSANGRRFGRLIGFNGRSAG
jgi:hypothetical protein